MDGQDAIVQMREVTKKFQYTKALDSVTLDIRRGTITGIIGANGAGKKHAAANNNRYVFAQFGQGNHLRM